MAVSDYGETSTKAVFHVEISDVSEGDEAILETPVTSVPQTIAIVVKHSCVEIKNLARLLTLGAHAQRGL